MNRSAHPRRIVAAATAPLIAIGFSSIGCGSSATSDSQAVTDTVDAYVAAVVSGDGSKACSYLTASMRRQVMQDQAGPVGGNHASCAGIESRLHRSFIGYRNEVLAHVRVRGRHAQARTTVQFGRGSGEGLYYLVKNGDSWKIARVFGTSSSGGSSG